MPMKMVINAPKTTHQAIKNFSFFMHDDDVRDVPMRRSIGRLRKKYPSIGKWVFFLTKLSSAAKLTKLKAIRVKPLTISKIIR